MLETTAVLQRFEYNQRQSNFHVTDMRERPTGEHHGWEIIIEDMSNETYYKVCEFQEKNYGIIQGKKHPAYVVVGWIICYLVENRVRDENVKFTYLNDVYQLFLKSPSKSN